MILVLLVTGVGSYAHSPTGFLRSRATQNYPLQGERVGNPRKECYVMIPGQKT